MPSENRWRTAVRRQTGADIADSIPLSGGSLSNVRKVVLSDGSACVVKTAMGKATNFQLEARMLHYLAEHSRLPVPHVIEATDQYLVLTFLDGSTGLDSAAQRDAAEKLAALHAVTADCYGFDFDTVIGPLSQPNPQKAGWREFFLEHRLLYITQTARDAGRLSAAHAVRIEKLAARLDDLLDEPAAPSLVHGDVWTGNILARDGRVTGFVDPAIYFGDAEMDLAFGTLFGPLGEPFFARYRELRPIRPGFFEVRRDIYNLWHLLMHVYFFGGGYLTGVEHTLERHGV